MATPISISPSFLRVFFGCFVFFIFVILCSPEKGFASAEGDTKTDLLLHTHTVEVNSLQPATTCILSTQGPYNNKESVLEVVHKHGLCNQHKSQSNPTDQDRTQILKQDEARVSSIHYRLNSLTLPDAATNTIPVQYGLELGSSNYIVTVGLGTPAKNFSLLIDTGSDLTWTQCRPCVRSCYKQKEPMFDPSHSTSYSNISCESAACSQLTVAGIDRDCSAATCTYC